MPYWSPIGALAGHEWYRVVGVLRGIEWYRVGYGTTNVGYGTTNADAGVGIGMKKGDSKNLIKRQLISQ